MQKPILILFLFTFLIYCDKFPPNPTELESEPVGVFIQYMETEYVSVNPPADGMTATMVNVISFRIVVKNLKAKALEFYGKAIMDGLPENRIHAIHFRKDSLVLEPETTNYQFNVLNKIEPESTYIIVRPQYPTNEYSPFVDDRGRIESIEINEVWAYREDGSIQSVSLVDSLSLF